MATDTANLQLEAYKLLHSQLQHEETTFWARNQLLLVLNLGLLTGLTGILGLLRSPVPAPAASAEAVTYAIPGTPLLRYLPLLLCSIGVIIAILWVFIVERGRAIYDIWVEQLKRLEKELSSIPPLMTETEDLLKKGRITPDGSRRVNVLGRSMRVYDAWRWLGGLFVLVWLGLVVGVLCG